uniref:Uncharacterized protein n=1 Tax=Neolamprologus brichardi TaxID=32507 RepID=A0A3Q4H9N5_NEOBR
MIQFRAQTPVFWVKGIWPPKVNCIAFSRICKEKTIFPLYTMQTHKINKTMESSSQGYSGPEDNSTDPHETLTETSTLTFVDGRSTEESAESRSLHGVGMVYLKEFVLIDDDEDGDMSLREKTVTDVSLMDGKAADLVCSRLLSTSSGSVSEYKETSAPDAPPPEEPEAAHEKKSCCLCTLL